MFHRPPQAPVLPKDQNDGGRWTFRESRLRRFARERARRLVLRWLRQFAPHYGHAGIYETQITHQRAHDHPKPEPFGVQVMQRHRQGSQGIKGGGRQQHIAGNHSVNGATNAGHQWPDFAAIATGNSMQLSDEASRTTIALRLDNAGGINERRESFPAFNLCADLLKPDGAPISPLRRRLARQTRLPGATWGVSARTGLVRACTDHVRARTSHVRVRTDHVRVRTDHVRVRTSPVRARTRLVRARPRSVRARTGPVSRRNKSLSAEGGASQLVHLKQEMRISFCKLSFPVHLSSAAWRVPLAVWDIPHLKPGSEASFLCRRVL